MNCLHSREHIKCFFLIALLVTCAMNICAQSTTNTETWAKNLLVFGKSIPQEEVFIHLDNTSYYIGDTIYYKAYIRLSTGEPSTLSGLLYVELLDNDGYLVEREKIKMTNGQGHGCFVLEDSLYGGFYELRAYTRWQLNWGRTKHPSTERTNRWFYSKKMHDEFFQDYDKLYSRVFPVYNKPDKPGNYSQNMVLRPLRTYQKAKYEKPEADLSFYPEGGHIVVGTKTNIAFQADGKDGKHLKGTLTVKDSKDSVVATAQTESRGRGSFILDVKPDEKYKCEFEWGDSYSSQAELPEAEKEGCALQVSISNDNIHLALQNVGAAATQELAYTVMCHGVLKAYKKIAVGASQEVDIDASKMPTGVAQVTIYNDEGRIWADRMVFVRHSDFKTQTLTLTGVKDGSYSAFEKGNMTIHGPADATVSVAVRDKANSEYTFDSGNILTEMLLASQIRGFVEQPEYFFEENDAKHNRALDLLLMVQGWRRYDWHQMAFPNSFHVYEPYEQTELIVGEVNKVSDETKLDICGSPAQVLEESDPNDANYIDLVNTYSYCEKYFSSGFVHYWHGLVPATAVARLLEFNYGYPDSSDASIYYTAIRKSLIHAIAAEEDGRRSPATAPKHEVTVHAEFSLDHKAQEGENAAVGDMMTYDGGQFKIQAPALDGYCYFFCTASDQEKWKDGKQPVWIASAEVKMDDDGDNGEINYPEFYVRLKSQYPRWVKPYTFYQACQSESPRRRDGKLVSVDDATIMNEVVIGAKHSGLKAFDASKPAFVLDAYDAFNATVDAGMCAGYYIGAAPFIANIARTYIGDMGMERDYELDRLEPRFNDLNLSYSWNDFQLSKFGHLHFLNKVYIYTDYSPRREGDKRYEQSDQPSVTVNLRKDADNTIYATYRDRRKVLWGYSTCTDFYNRDYSNVATPDPNDYRRTLYWNPDLKLDENGQAKVQFFNNNSTSELSVTVDGMAKDGQLLTAEK